MASTTADKAPRQCSKCKKSESSTANALKHCAKCKGSLYCSRECQTADWKGHKKICATQAAHEAKRVEDEAARLEDGSTDSETEEDDDDDDSEWDDVDASEEIAEHLASLPREDVYKELIYMCQEDIEAWNRESGVTVKGAKKTKEFFGILLDTMEKEDSYLPTWWDEEARLECEKLAKKMQYKSTSSSLADMRRTTPKKKLRKGEEHDTVVDNGEEADKRWVENLTNLPHEEAYKVIIDKFMTFHKIWEQNNRPLKYPGEVEVFFIKTLAGMKQAGLLPIWWNGETQRECEKMAKQVEYKVALASELSVPEKKMKTSQEALPARVARMDLTSTSRG